MKKYINILLIIMMCFSFSACKSKEDTLVDGLIENMSLEKKIAQMMVICLDNQWYVSTKEYEPFTVMTPQVANLLRDCGFGGIIFWHRNLQTSKQSMKLISDINEANASGDNVPLLLSVDEEGGGVNRVYYSTFMPGNMALAANGSTDDIYDCASIIADEMKDIGLNTDFAPVVDVNSNPANPVIGIRSFSDITSEVSRLCVPFIKGLSDNKVISTLKHFPGHGDTDTDSHTGLPLVNKTYEQIANNELLPFKAGIEAGADMVMSAHIQFPKIDSSRYLAKDGSLVYLPATLSRTIITEILRQDMGFDGVVITDALTMDAILDYFDIKDVAKLAIEAGVDMLLNPVNSDVSVNKYVKDLKDYITMIADMVRNGEISETRIDESVRRILKMKYRKGLFEKPVERQYDVGSLEHHQRELEITKNAVTIVKNDNDVLPLKSRDKTLFLVPYNSQYNSVDYALDKLIEEGVIKANQNIGIHSYEEDYTQTHFNERIVPLLKDLRKLVLVSSMYDHSDLDSAQFRMMDMIVDYCKQKRIDTVLISSQLPYDLARFDTDGALACYYATGMPEKPLDYTKDVRSYGPNLVVAIMSLYDTTEAKGKLPVNIPELLYANGRYVYLYRLRYERGFSINN